MATRTRSRKSKKTSNPPVCAASEYEPDSDALKQHVLEHNENHQPNPPVCTASEHQPDPDALKQHVLQHNEKHQSSSGVLRRSTRNACVDETSNNQKMTKQSNRDKKGSANKQQKVTEQGQKTTTSPLSEQGSWPTGTSLKATTLAAEKLTIYDTSALITDDGKDYEEKYQQEKAQGVKYVQLEEEKEAE